MSKVSRFSQSGQVGVAVIFMMVLMSTVGFTLATRAARDVQTARQTQDATQAFTAAEAIVERVLSSSESDLEQEPSEDNYTDLENIEGSYRVSAESELDFRVAEGEVVEIPLFSPGNPPASMTGNSVAIEWAESTDCSDEPASLIISVVNGTESSLRTFASAGCDRGSDNIPISVASPTRFARRFVVPLQAGDTAVRVMPLYSETPVLAQAVGGWSELPTQMYRISSQAQNAQGRETKAVQVDRSRDSAPGILNFALVSGSTIVQ